MNYLLHLLVLLSIYATVVSSLNVLVGHTGLLSMSHAAFYAFGMYTSAILMAKCGVCFSYAILSAAALTFLISTVVAIFVLRLQGDQFIFGTMAVQALAFACALNLESLTGGPLGLSGVPRPAVGGQSLSSLAPFALVSALLSAGAVTSLAWLLRTSFGRALRAVRDDQKAAASLGINTRGMMIAAFAVASTYASIGGVLYGTYMSFIDPSSASLDESVFMLSALLLGGSGNAKGPLVGAVVMIFLPEILRFMSFPESVAANLRQITVGAILILAMRFRPQGLLGEFSVDS